MTSKPTQDYMDVDKRIREKFNIPYGFRDDILVQTMGHELISFIHQELDKEHADAYEAGARMQAKMDADTISEAVKAERERLYEKLDNESVYVKYTKDNGIGVAVPMSYVMKLFESK